MPPRSGGGDCFFDRFSARPPCGGRLVGVPLRRRRGRCASSNYPMVSPALRRREPSFTQGSLRGHPHIRPHLTCLRGLTPAFGESMTRKLEHQGVLHLIHTQHSPSHPACGQGPRTASGANAWVGGRAWTRGRGRRADLSRRGEAATRKRPTRRRPAGEMLWRRSAGAWSQADHHSAVASRRSFGASHPQNPPEIGRLLVGKDL